VTRYGNRRGESRRRPFRSGRLFKVDNEWYVETREGVNLGPYESREEAERAIESFIKVLTDEGDEAAEESNRDEGKG
jgi:hypothetical protein